MTLREIFSWIGSIFSQAWNGLLDFDLTGIDLTGVFVIVLWVLLVLVLSNAVAYVFHKSGAGRVWRKIDDSIWDFEKSSRWFLRGIYWIYPYLSYIFLIVGYIVFFLFIFWVSFEILGFLGDAFGIQWPN